MNTTANATHSGGLVVSPRPRPSRRRCPRRSRSTRGGDCSYHPSPSHSASYRSPACSAPGPPSRLLKPAASLRGIPTTPWSSSRGSNHSSLRREYVRFPVEGLARGDRNDPVPGSTPFEQPCGGGGLRGDPSAYVAVSALRPRALCAHPGGCRRGPTNPPRAWARDPSGPCRGPCTDETGTAEGAPPRRARSPCPARSRYERLARHDVHRGHSRGPHRGVALGGRPACSPSRRTRAPRGAHPPTPHVGPGSYCVVPGRETAEASKVLPVRGRHREWSVVNAFMTRRRRPERNASLATDRFGLSDLDNAVELRAPLSRARIHGGGLVDSSAMSGFTSTSRASARTSLGGATSAAGSDPRVQAQAGTHRTEAVGERDGRAPRHRQRRHRVALVAEPKTGLKLPGES